MKAYNRIIFVAQTGCTREPMAVGILNDFVLDRPIEVLARGLVVLFPEPMNPKAEAVLISNGISMEGYTSIQLEETDLTEDTLVLTMEGIHRDRILETYENVNPENVHVLTEFVGDELEVVNPYGGALPAYGLCYEALRKTIGKLVALLNEE